MKKYFDESVLLAIFRGHIIEDDIAANNQIRNDCLQSINIMTGINIVNDNNLDIALKIMKHLVVCLRDCGPFVSDTQETRADSLGGLYAAYTSANNEIGRGKEVTSETLRKLGLVVESPNQVPLKTYDDMGDILPHTATVFRYLLSRSLQSSNVDKNQYHIYAPLLVDWWGLEIALSDAQAKVRMYSVDGESYTFAFAIGKILVEFNKESSIEHIKYQVELMLKAPKRHHKSIEEQMSFI